MDHPNTQTQAEPTPNPSSRFSQYVLPGRPPFAVVCASVAQTSPSDEYQRSMVLRTSRGRQQQQSIEDKLHSGLLEDVAQVFKDLSEQQKRRRLNDSERKFRMRALSLLCRELAAALGRREEEMARDIDGAVRR